MKFLSIIKDQKRGCDKNPYGRSKKEIRRKIDSKIPMEFPPQPPQHPLLKPSCFETQEEGTPSTTLK